MQAAVRALRQEKYHLEVLTPYQLKVNDLSFYPGKGTIYRDGDHAALPETGMKAFMDQLAREPFIC